MLRARVRADVSVTGWMILGYLAAREAGLEFDPAPLDDGLAYIDGMTSTETWRTGYQARGSPPARTPEDMEHWPPELSESLTALATRCRIDAGLDLRSEIIRGGIAVVQTQRLGRDPDEPRRDFYSWQHTARVMRALGGKPWQRWREHVQRDLVRSQLSRGELAGTWEVEIDPWADDGGRVYLTSVAAMILQECLAAP